MIRNGSLATVLAGVITLAYSLATPALAQADGSTVYSVTPERLAAGSAALAGLAGAVIGGVALARSAGRPANRRRAAIVALVLAPIGLLIGGLVVATADGGVGTGNGVAGGVVAMIVGFIGTAFGGLALVRTGRAG